MSLVQVTDLTVEFGDLRAGRGGVPRVKTRS
ncbi:hypothetical protein SGRIM128S_09046 [Streptomyces griseomycini]